MANQIAQISAPRPRAWVLPHLTFVGAVQLSTLALPLWYLLGLDQFIWPFIGLGLGLLFILQRISANRPIVITPLVRASAAFLIVQLISGLFIADPEMYIVFLRTILGWGGGLLTLVVLINTVHTRKQYHRLLWVWAGILLLACVVGGVAFVLREGFTFKTLALYVVPASMRDGETAATVWTRSFLAETTYLFGIPFYRVRSFFLYANSFAAALLWAAPMLVYLTRWQRRFSWRWWLLVITLGLVVLNLLVTTSRTAILSLFAGAGFFWYLRTRPPKRVVWLILGLLLVAAFLWLVLIYQGEIFRTIEETFTTLVTLKGQSHVTRYNILYYSLVSWSERPIFGWGTPREMSLYGFAENYPRLGSHSQFLSALYRHGIVGLLAFLWMMLALFRRARQIPDRPALHGLRGYVAWALFGFMVHLSVFQMDVDLITMFFAWQFMALIDLAPRLAREQQPNAPAVEEMA